jgi:hypothetical protein
MVLKAFFLLLGLFAFLGAPPASAEQDTRFYLDKHSDHHRYRFYKANEGRYYEWTKTGLSEVSLCMELDTETRGEQYRMLVEDVYCPKLRKTFAWSEPGHGHHSRCFEVDAETRGLRYKRLAAEEKCGKPKTIFAWVKAETDRKESCYAVDAESRGEKFRLPVKHTSCPQVFDAYVAFGKKQPLLNPVVPYQTKDGGGRMPASLAKPVSAEEEEEPGEGIREYLEDPEDMIRHVPGSSRKGY